MKLDSTSTILKATELLNVIRVGSTRGLDFVTLEELRKRTGISNDLVVKFSLSEMLANALDKEEATKIDVTVTSEGEFNIVKVSDNGSKKISKEELETILDFDNKASSKRGILRVSRGYLGNALKCIFGYSYALIKEKGLPIQSTIVESGSFKFEVTLKPNLVTIEKCVKTTKREDNGLTVFSVKFPKQDGLDSKGLEDILIATSMVNPSRQISYDILGKKQVSGIAGNNSIRNETSVLWYKEKQFETLLKDYANTTPNTPLKDFITLFRGFTAKPIIWEILQEISSSNHDYRNENLQFLPTTPLTDISESTVQTLYSVMKAKSKPIEKRSIPSVLGVVGKEAFEKISKQNGWSLRYLCLPATKLDCDLSVEVHNLSPDCKDLSHVEYPYLVEFVIFDRPNDEEGLKVYQCVNFMASREDIFSSRFFNINYRLGQLSITKETPVTVIVHLVCPVLKWLNYGKSDLDE